MPPAPTARAQLKAATDGPHRRLDLGMGGFDLRAPMDYVRFLGINAAALIPLEDAVQAAGIEQALPDWPFRRRSKTLADDLRALGAAPQPFVQAPILSDLPAAMGCAYVLEGSRLGGRLLARTAAASDHASVRDNMRFLRHGEGIALWPTFLARLEDVLSFDTDRSRAQSAALSAFAMFQVALDRVEVTSGRTEAP